MVRPAKGAKRGSSPREAPHSLVARIDGLEDRIMQRFDRADEDRRDMGDRVGLVEGRLWKIVLGVAGCGILELVHLLVARKS